MNTRWLAVITILSVGRLWGAEMPPDDVSVAPAKPVGNFLIHEVSSEFQAKPTKIRILLPEPYDPARRYPVVYVLPVEAGDEAKYGDGLAEIANQKLHRKHAAIFVAPTFADLPWYADHPSDRKRQHESYFLQAVVPYIEKHYPAQEGRKGALLLGFSKSGWGAWSLLSRHPDRFARAAAWDAPLAMQWPSKYGSAPLFATPENFAKYKIADLLAKHPPDKQPRLILTGYGNFRADHQQTKTLLDRQKIAVVYRDGPERKHDWHSGWVAEAVELLLQEELTATR